MAISITLALLSTLTGVAEASLVDGEGSAGSVLEAWTSTAWVQTTRSDFEAGVPGQVDTQTSPGDVRLARNDRIFAFQGGTAAFWGYGVTANSWASMANALAAVGAGGALAYDGSRYIYAFRGNNSNAFWRYDTVGNSWSTMTNAPATVGAGGALAYDGSRYIYAFRGNNRIAFWRYDTVGNSWSTMTNALATVGAGGALAYDGSRYIYAFRGNNSNAFWRYDTVNNSWSTMADAPATVGAGGALAYDGSRYIYAFRGNTNNAFWRYDTVNNSWLAMADAPANVASGGALVFVPAYVNSATIASPVLDAGVTGARWDALFWDETLPAGTDIVFEVRAGDVLFAKDAANPSWILVGGTSPISTGLPFGRYMQWRATLTTSNTSVTPVLHEVRLYYF